MLRRRAPRRPPCATSPACPWAAPSPPRPWRSRWNRPRDGPPRRACGGPAAARSSAASSNRRSSLSTDSHCERREAVSFRHGACACGRWLRRAVVLLATTVLSSSPILDPRAQIEFMRPGAARLLVEAPIVFGDGVGIEDAVALLQRIALGEIVADEGGVDGAVDDGVRDMDACGAELARHA